MALSMTKARPRTITPEEEGIELHPDAWRRFERTVRKTVKAHPVHRTAKATGEDRHEAKDRVRAKSSG
jgi:hypothetical protein